MENGFFIITGTSKGIGEALAKNLLNHGQTVLGVSRGRSAKLEYSEYHHLTFDLNYTNRLEEITQKASEIVCQQSFRLICLVNNACASVPLGTIENCPAEEIDAHVKIGLIAPMILTSLFVHRFSNSKARKKVAFISSGAAFAPFSGDSIYCSVKAGMNMFAQCVALEQKDEEFGFEVITIGPGMVDTYMQQVARSKTVEEYPSAYLLKEAFDKGLLEKPETVAEKIVIILENKYNQGQYIKVSEV
jgi:benzil reductase ((S)-benzoin forming)